MRSTTRTYRTDRAGRAASGYDDEPRRGGPQLVRWGAVFAGAVLALGLLALLSLLWFALAYGSEITGVRENLQWYVGISSIFCLFVGGILAGWLSGVRGWSAGTINGLTMWALLLIATLSVGVPSVLNVFSLGTLDTAVGEVDGLIAPAVGSALWASFWSMLAAFFTAGLGGAIGGSVDRHEDAYEPRHEAETEEYYAEEEEVTDPPTRRHRAS
jgi:putative membrane protein (TIGR04086 family)